MKKEENLKEQVNIICRKHKEIIVALILASMIAMIFLALVLSGDRRNNEVLDTTGTKTSNVQGDKYKATEKIVDKKVYITGEVKKPGVYSIAMGDRIEDIIKYAGGVTEYAVLEYVNLAEIVSDEQHIIIPNDDVRENIETMVVGSKKININKATRNELTQITGVGDVTAESIIKYREEQGKFKTIEDIKKVSGIGEKTFEKLRNEIDIK